MTTTEKLGAAIVVLLAAALAGVGLLPVPVLVLSLPFLVVMVRRPVLRRLAIRNAVRRPRETALVLLGSMLGTAIITGSFVVGDTLDSSLRRSAFTQLGPIDEVVRVPADAPEVRAQVEQAMAGLPDELTDGTLTIVTTDAVVATAGDAPQAEPQAAVLEVDFARARAFGEDPAATGVDGPTPEPGQAVLGEDLARTLDAGPGDDVVLHVYGGSYPLQVVRVLPQRGVAGVHIGFGSQSPNVFVAPGTLEAAHRAATAPGRPPTVMVAVSNEGGVLGGAALSERVERAIRDALAGVPAGVDAVKQDVLDVAARAGEEFTALFGGIGFFSVLAGVVLLVNIFVMLAQERKTELGMLRAVGLRRAGLVGSFSLEGWLYALGAAAVGTVAGLGVGRVVVIVAAGIFGQGEFSLDLRYSAELASVQSGFTTGFVISLVTVVGTSLGIARLNVIRAIRDLPDPPGGTTRRRASVVGGGLLVVVGGVLFALGIGSDVPALVLVGPAVLVFGLGLLLVQRLPSRPVVTLFGAGLVAWGVMAFQLFPTSFREAGIPVFVVQGVLLTASAVALAARNQDVLGSALGRLAGRTPPTAVRLGLAYPLARRLRTSLILTMYALVVFTLTFITTFSHLFSGQIDDFTRKISGGFDVRMESSISNPAAPDAVPSVAGVEAVAEQAMVLAEFEARLTDGFEPWPVASFDETFVERGPVALNQRAAQYEDDAAVYRAVLADPSLVIVSEFFLQDGGGPPDRALGPDEKLVMRDPLSGRSRELTVVAVAEAGFGNLLAYVSRAALDEVFASSVTTNLLFVAVADDADPRQVADALNARFLTNGADAQSFREIVNENLSEQQQFFRLMQGYLALGLVVGIAGLGVVMVRAVRERRRQIGVLRALGFQAASVRRAFVVESSFVAFQGIVVGVVLANITAWRLVANATFGAQLRFSIPWTSLAVLALGTFVASLLATLAPAQQASRIRPAVALRIAD